ncbi:unnamed protein product [Camellia sinensis]
MWGDDTATPGTPGGPLISSIRVDSLSYSDRKLRPGCKCLPVEAPSWGAPHTCLLDFPAPDVSLTRKLGAEFVGTFILIFAATGGPIVNQKYNGVESLIGNAACAGLAVMIVILSTGCNHETRREYSKWIWKLSLTISINIL